MMVTESTGSNVDQESGQSNINSSANVTRNLVIPSPLNSLSDFSSTSDEQHTVIVSSPIPSHDVPQQTAIDQCIIVIKVRTLDHRTHHIRVSHDALVSELKERIEFEIGVGSGRQRLIYRGKVLKNDQKINTYALEDGHVIHLVIRNSGDNTVGAQDAGINSDAESASARLDDMTWPDNSPFVNGQNRILMGTIAVPTGSDVDISFLRSMIESMMIPLQEPSTMAASTNYDRSTRRSQQRDSMNATNAIITSSLSPGIRVDEDRMTLSRLEVRAENALNAIASNLDNAAYDFQDLTNRSLSPELIERNIANLQNYLTRLQELFGRFQRRMNVLPVAIDVSRSRTEDPQTVIATMRAIRTLGSLGEASQILCRIAQLFFLTSPETSGIVRGNVGVSASNGGSVASGRTYARSEDLLHGARNAVMRRPRYVAINADSRHLTDHVDQYSAQAHRAVTAATLQQEAPLIQSPVFTSTPLSPHHETVTTNPNTTFFGAIWDFRAFLRSFYQRISISTAYGLFHGNPDSIQQVLSEIRYGIQLGSYFPPVDSLSLNQWCDTFVDNARIQLRQLSIPESVTITLTNNDGEDFAAALLHPLRQHLPQLLDQILHISSDYSSCLTCLELIRAMLRRWIEHLRNRTLQAEDAGVTDFLVELFAFFGLDRTLAQFMLISLLRWIFPDMPTSIAPDELTSRRRHREQDVDESDIVGLRSKRRCI